MKMTIRACTEKERKWHIKNVDLTKSSITLTDIKNSRASLSEMMLMISEKHKHVFRKTLASFPEKMLVFLVNECKSPLKTGIILYKTPILAPFYAHFGNVKDSITALLLDKMIEFNDR